MEKIIIIEDDEIIREELKNFLSKYGYEIVVPTSFDNVVQFILNENANLVLLDINLPIFDGYYICREVRKKSDIPIIIVTSRDSDMDELMSMNLGADDFVTKPYNTQILLARIAALLKRSGLNITTNNILTYKDFQLNLSNATITYNEKEIELTIKEFDLLCLLVANKGRVLTYGQIYQMVWKEEPLGNENIAVGSNIRSMRRKLFKAFPKSPFIINCMRNVGYSFDIRS